MRGGVRILAVLHSCNMHRELSLLLLYYYTADLLLAPSPVSIVLSKALLQEVIDRGAAGLVDGLLDVHLPAEVTL